MIYLDNAATSWPKPPEVLKAMTDVLERAGGNPGRSGHRLSIEAARVMYDAREEVARFFNATDPMRVIFTSNATHAINLALMGLLKPGDRVVTSSVEHNAVMRPLRYLEKRGVELTVVLCARDGSLGIPEIEKALSSPARLVVMNHASNVVGTILPVKEVATLARRAGAFMMVDAAQTAGSVPIDIREMGIDLLAFTGHKELMGPPGSGGLVIGGAVDTSKIEPLIRGGTGSQSELEEQPDHLPDKYESGTPNITGIAGLLAGIRWVEKKSSREISSHNKKIMKAMIDGLSNISGVKVYGTLDLERSAPVISISIGGKQVSEVGMRLDEEHGILCRVGLHCAPAAHKTIGTFPEGTVRLSPGVFTTVEDVDSTLEAINRISRS